LIVGDSQVDLQSEDVIAERDMFVRDVRAKELDILELKKDNKKLTIVTGPGLDAGEDLHERELQLIGEVESNSTAVQKLGTSLPVAAEAQSYICICGTQRSPQQVTTCREVVRPATDQRGGRSKLKEKLSKAEDNV